ncbi:MAG: hypothetical protein RLP15_02720 [Cryomorphaceae bacterium]
MQANTIFNKALILLFAFFAMSSTALAGKVVLKFKVVDENDIRIANVEIKVYKGNNLFHTELTRVGKAKIGLPTGEYYTVEIAHKGRVTKRIIVDTRSEDGLFGSYDYHFYVELDRSEVYNGYAKADDFLDYPVTLIEFDPNEMELDYNATYMRSTRLHKQQMMTDELALSLR